MVRRWWLAALVVFAVGGCAESSPEPAPPRPPVWVEAECPASSPTLAPERGGIPDDFDTAWVLRCREEERDVPGEGTWNVVVTERADGPMTELLELLRRPSEPNKNQQCPAIAIVPPYFLLVDADGRALLPVVPTDGCSIPRAAVGDLLDTLPFRAVSEKRLGQTTSQLSVETGCSDSWKDTIAIDAGTAAPARELWSAPVGPVRVCVYDRIGGEPPTGRLTSGHVITETSALTEALDTAGPASDCATRHTSFAVLTTDDQAAWAIVELDGCLRLQRPDHTLAQLDQRVADLVTTR